MILSTNYWIKEIILSVQLQNLHKKTFAMKIKDSLQKLTDIFDLSVSEQNLGYI